MNKRILPSRTRFALLLASVVLLHGRGVSAQVSPRTAYEAGRNASAGNSRVRLFAQGMELAQARLAIAPDDPEGLYWLAVNMGAHALERGKMAALPVLPRMEALLLRLDRVAPDYEHAGAARVLGRLYHQAPAILSIGSSQEARRFLERAMALAPGHPGNLAFAADFLVSHGDKALARLYATKGLASLAGKPLSPEEKEWDELDRHVLETTR